MVCWCALLFYMDKAELYTQRLRREQMWVYRQSRVEQSREDYGYGAANLLLSDTWIYTPLLDNFSQQALLRFCSMVPCMPCRTSRERQKETRQKGAEYYPESINGIRDKRHQVHDQAHGHKCSKPARNEVVIHILLRLSHPEMRPMGTYNTPPFCVWCEAQGLGGGCRQGGADVLQLLDDKEANFG